MPLTNEQRAKLRNLTIGNTLRPSHVEALKALMDEAAAWREVCAEFAYPAASATGGMTRESWMNECDCCWFCDAVVTVRDDVDTTDHAPNCPVGRAQAMLRETAQE